jgi:hypothetical protein
LEKCAVPIFRTEDGDSRLLWNTGFYQHVHMVTQPKRTSQLLFVVF